MLIPARTDTSYFHDYIFHGKADEVRFIRGRLTFTDEDDRRTNDGQTEEQPKNDGKIVVMERAAAQA